MSSKRFLCLLLFFGVAFSSANGGSVELGPRPEISVGQSEAKEQFQKALDFHQKGVAGDSSAVVQALGLLGKLHDEYPEDSLILAFWGSASTLRARDAIFYRKMGYLREGLEAIDRAVDMDPENPNVRVVRAVNSYQLPGMFGRRSVAREDFEILLQWAEKNPDVFGEDLLRFTYYHAGLFASRERNSRAKDYLNQALEVPSQSVSDQEIERAISEAS